MGAVLALVATAVALAFAAWPLLGRRNASEQDSSEMSDLLTERDLAISDIRELDFDRDLGNLSDDDHQTMREQSKRRAVAVLKRLNAQESRIDEEIEQAVAALRSAAPEA
ncbi:MAG TPA: hypothetical protein VKU60_03650 [Chloroflexota bacterium]|nr:hypothetical protein [Chloroflexota bacterium]